MTVLGLCGQSGAGKTTVLDTLMRLGAEVCDCDKVSREIMSRGTPCTNEVISVFGEGICSCGEIDRKSLGKIVFFDKDKLETLTEITHRYIKAEVRERIDNFRKKGKGLFVLDAPLLFESGLDIDCDLTLVIIAEREKRIERIMKRDEIDKALAEKRIDSQLSEEKLKELADEVITNNGTKKELAEAVEDFAERRGLLT